MDDKWFSVDEIADYLGVKQDTIYKWANRKQLPVRFKTIMGAGSEYECSAFKTSCPGILQPDG